MLVEIYRPLAQTISLNLDAFERQRRLLSCCTTAASKSSLLH
jgi:hypothetical protein